MRKWHLGLFFVILLGSQEALNVVQALDTAKGNVMFRRSVAHSLNIAKARFQATHLKATESPLAAVEVHKEVGAAPHPDPSLSEVASSLNTELQVDTYAKTHAQFVVGPEAIVTYVVQGLTILIGLYSSHKVKSMIAEIAQIQKTTTKSFDRELAKQHKLAELFEKTVSFTLRVATNEIKPILDQYRAQLKGTMFKFEAENVPAKHPDVVWFESFSRALLRDQPGSLLNKTDPASPLYMFESQLHALDHIARSAEVLSVRYDAQAAGPGILAKGKQAFFEQFDKAKLGRMAVVHGLTVIAQTLLTSTLQALTSYLGLALAVYDLAKAWRQYKTNEAACKEVKIDYTYMSGELIQDLQYTTCRWLQSVQLERTAYFTENDMYMTMVPKFVSPEDAIVLKDSYLKLYQGWTQFDKQKVATCKVFDTMTSPVVRTSDVQVPVAKGFVRVWRVGIDKYLLYCWIFASTSTLFCVRAEAFLPYLISVPAPGLNKDTKVLVIPTSAETTALRDELMQMNDYWPIDLAKHPRTGRRKYTLAHGHITLQAKTWNIEFKPVVEVKQSDHDNGDYSRVAATRTKLTQYWMDAIASAAQTDTPANDLNLHIITDLWATERVNRSFEPLVKNNPLFVAANYGQRVARSYQRVFVRTQYYDFVHAANALQEIAYENVIPDKIGWLDEEGTTQSILLMAQEQKLTPDDIKAGKWPKKTISSIVQVIVSRDQHAQWQNATMDLVIPGPFRRNNYRFVGELRDRADPSNSPVNFVTSHPRAYVKSHLAVSYFPGAPIVAISTNCREEDQRPGWNRVPIYIENKCHTQRIGMTKQHETRRLCYAKDRRLYTPNYPHGVPPLEYKRITDTFEATRTKWDERRQIMRACRQRLELERIARYERERSAHENEMRQEINRRDQCRDARKKMLASILKPNSASVSISLTALTGVPSNTRVASSYSVLRVSRGNARNVVSSMDKITEIVSSQGFVAVNKPLFADFITVQAKDWLRINIADFGTFSDTPVTEYEVFFYNLLEDERQSKKNEFAAWLDSRYRKKKPKPRAYLESLLAPTKKRTVFVSKDGVSIELAMQYQLIPESLPSFEAIHAIQCDDEDGTYSYFRE